MTPAVAYLRCSGQGQVEGDSFPRQEAAIQAYAEIAGYKVIRFYREEGQSGKLDYDARPAMRRMIQELHEVDCAHVIVEKMDRLARDLIVQETIIGKFQGLGIKLVSTMEPDLCSADPSRVFIRQVLGAVAQLDRSLIVARTKAARDRIRASGARCEGRKPYGHKPGEPETIALIRELQGRGFGLGAIAASLNEQGVTTRSGGDWFAAQVQRVIKRKTT
jgi:DNA invertase Pin-like site-specific DNA recombinase